MAKIKDFYNKFHRKRRNRVVKLMGENRYAFLKGLLKEQKGNILVVGCGSKEEMSIISENSRATGIDISEVAIEKSRKKYPRFDYAVADAENLPFGDKEFDCVVCSEVIEHLPNDEKFIQEAFRVLKDGGRFIVTTPNWFSWYGLARKIGEPIVKRPLTSDDQPIDHWYTFGSLKKKVINNFRIKTYYGLWYFPPFGKGDVSIPDIITFPFVFILNPINKAIRRVFPCFGHCIAFDMVKKAS